MDFLNTHKKTVFISASVLLIAAAIITYGYKRSTFINNAVGYVVAPIQELATNIDRWFSEKIGSIKDFDSLEDSNKALLEENQKLKLQLGRLDMLEKDNENLRGLLDLSAKYPELSVIGADIIARDSNNWSKSFNINKGTQDGLKENMVILADGGLCGKITKAGYNYSQVIPLIDDTSSVGAQIKRTGDSGFVKGDLKLSEMGYCRMENIDLDAEILINDEIVTSSLGGIYPPGITIGFVTEIHTDVGGLNKYALIKLAVDFKHLETVLVVNENFEREFLDTTPSEGPEN